MFTYHILFIKVNRDMMKINTKVYKRDKVLKMKTVSKYLVYTMILFTFS